MCVYVCLCVEKDWRVGGMREWRCELGLVCVTKLCSLVEENLGKLRLKRGAEAWV